MKVYREDVWWHDPVTMSVDYYPAGLYEEGERDEPTLRIPLRSLPKLVQWLDENGYIKPRFDTRLRDEDLKITHRLLDLLEVRAEGIGGDGA